MALKDIEDLIDNHSSLQYDESQNKVICRLTKHEMLPSRSSIESYVQGKKYRKAVEKSYDFDQHKPHIAPSTKKHHLHELFCFLTLRHVGRTPLAVERHVNGKRYKRALARWEKCQENGEKFVARGGKHRSKDSDSSVGGPGWSDDGGGDDDDNDEDDMDDLYPPEVFGASDDEEEDDDSDEEEAEENTPPVPQKSGGNTSNTQNGNDSEGSDYDMAVLDSGDGSVRQDKGPAASKAGKKENAKRQERGSKGKIKGTTGSGFQFGKRKEDSSLPEPMTKKKKKKL